MTRFWDGRTDRRTDGQTDGVTALLDLLSPSATQVKTPMCICMINTSPCVILNNEYLMNLLIGFYKRSLPAKECIPLTAELLTLDT